MLNLPLTAGVICTIEGSFGTMVNGHQYPHLFGTKTRILVVVLHDMSSYRFLRHPATAVGLLQESVAAEISSAEAISGGTCGRHIVSCPDSNNEDT